MNRRGAEAKRRELLQGRRTPLSFFSTLSPLCLCVFVVFLLLLPPRSQAQGFADNPAYQTERGPLAIRNGRPYNLLFLQFAPEGARLLAPGENRYDAQLDLINNMLIPRRSGGVAVVEDNEIDRLSLAWRRGMPQGEFGLFLPLIYRNGGLLDGVLNTWHKIWGIPGNAEDNPFGRKNFPSDRSLLSFTDTAGRPLFSAGTAFGWGDLALTYKRSLRPETPRAALATRFGLKLPTGNPGLALGSGGIDIGLSLDGQYHVGREVILYTNIGGVLMSQATRVPKAQRSLFQYLVAAEYRPNRRDSFLLQFDGNTTPVRTGNAFADRAPATATFGYKRVLNRHLILSASFSENGDFLAYRHPFFANVGPDFTTSLGLTWRR